MRCVRPRGWRTCLWRISRRAWSCVSFPVGTMFSSSKRIHGSAARRYRTTRERLFPKMAPLSGVLALHNFTIGQRKGLGFAAGKPLYVTVIDRENNRVVVADDESLRTTTCEVQDVNWIAHQASSEAVRATAKIRPKHVPAEATVTPLDATHARIAFDAPQPAITSGH